MEIIGQPGSTRLAEQLNLPLRAVTPDYFAAMNIQIVDGRGLPLVGRRGRAEGGADQRDFRAALLRRGTPIGRKVQFSRRRTPSRSKSSASSPTREPNALNEQAGPEIYFPLWQQHAFSKHLILHTRADPARARHAGPARAARGRSDRRGRAREDDGGCAAGIGGVAALRHASADRLCGDGDGAGAGRAVRRAVAVGRRPDEGDRGRARRSAHAGRKSFVSCCAKGIA